MATFNNSGSYAVLNTQKGIYYVQGGHYFNPVTFVDLGTTAPNDYVSLSSERSDGVKISGGALDSVVIGTNSTFNGSLGSGTTLVNPAIQGGSIDGAPIGQSTPAAGAFTGLNATSASILGALSAEGVNSTSNGQAASVTNTGTAMSQTFAAITYFDSARTANNKTADFLWSSGIFSARFKNDAGSSTATWLSASGGQAAGITGITSNSGTGSWVHTGAFSATGAITPSTTNGLVGTTLADNANAGSIGEVITNTGTAVSLTTATPANVTSVVLTAGDWDVYGSVGFNGTSSTSTSQVVGGLNTVSATLPAQPYIYQHQYGVGGFTSATLPNGAVPMRRINVSTTTTVYLVAQATFTASTETATGVIIARRAR